MAVIKCKMCGGDLDISEGLSVCECEYCGTKQTVPSADSEKKLTLFARANRLRAANEFGKAAGVCEGIVADFPEEAEAYWGLVLCKYGIEYVDDPATGKKIPTCHRSSFDVALDDPNFEQACENADGIARRQYREEAKELERIRQSIVEISGREEPYDVFICYKETGENGERTIDSVIAQDVYDALTDRGYRVFFSRISLEDRLGVDYEPYIFAALNSAKLMLAFGTDYEYYNAVWVKNEWSRFLKLMERDKSKHLIPCYKDLDPYDMPKEFRRLQAQDMGKVGAVQDLLRGVEKLLPRKGTEPAPQQAQQIVQQVVQGGGPNATALLQRGQMALEDGEWDKAKEYFDQILNMDAQNAEAYLGLTLAACNLQSPNDIGKISDRQKLTWLMERPTLRRTLRFGTDDLKQMLERQLAQAEQNTAATEVQLRKQAEELEAEKRRKAQELEAEKRIVHHMVAAGRFHTVGACEDGTVLAAGDSGDGRSKVSGWTDIVKVAAGDGHTVGLRADGTVLAVGNKLDGQCRVSDWNGIVAVAAGCRHTVGLRADGTVLAVGDNKDGQCDVSGWTNIVAVAAGESHTVGLRADGTVLAVGWNEYGQCNVNDWTEIIDITAGYDHTVGLCANGTVVAVGGNTSGQRNINNWTNIMAISAGYRFTVGLHTNGTVVASGHNKDGQCEVGSWKLFNTLNSLMQMRGAYTKRVNGNCEEAKVKLRAEYNSLQTELFNIKGLFAAKRHREIEARLKEIETELKQM